MDTARTFVRVINVDCINSVNTSTSNTRYYLPSRADVESYTVKAIALSKLYDVAINAYLTIIDKNNDVLLSQYPLNDLNLAYQLSNNIEKKLRLFNLKDINTRASYLDFAIAPPAIPYPIGVILAKIQFYI
jgi:hypothetical protein